MDLWNAERHHNAVFGYYKLKYSYYSTYNKMLDENATTADKRACKKLVDELAQNITEYQRDHAYYLELYNNENVQSKPQ